MNHTVEYGGSVATFEPPWHISDEARAYLLDPPPQAPPVDFADHAAVGEFRQLLHAEFLAEVESLEGPWVSRDETFGGVHCTRFAIDDATLDRTDVIVHLHGGSYFMGSPITNAALIVPIAQRTGLPVVSVDYRLAPEHPYPAAVDDAVAAYSALVSQHHVVAMYGESAGGGLALAASVALREIGVELPDRLALLSPWVDLTCSGDTYRTLVHVDPDFPDPADPPVWAAAYAGERVAEPKASPLFADLAGLPPTLIQVGGREILLSDSCRLDSALRRAGVPSTLDVWDGLWHVWQLWGHLPETRSAFDELATFLQGG